MEEEKRVMILDCDSVMFAIGNPNKVLDEFGVPMRTEDNKKFLYIDKTEEELKSSADFMMNDIFVSSNCTHYIGYIKGKHTISQRKAINPEYKSNRPKESPKWWNFCKDYLIKEYKVVEVDNIEVDDAVSITKNQLKDSFIVAIDKDLLNLEGKHFNWRKREWVEISKEQEKLYFWKSMITGDVIDGIKGIPGKGIKYAEKTLSIDFINYQSTVLNTYISRFGEYEGISLFYKNYMSLKLLDSYEGFIIPEPNKVILKLEENKVDNLL